MRKWITLAEGYWEPTLDTWVTIWVDSANRAHTFIDVHHENALKEIGFTMGEEEAYDRGWVRAGCIVWKDSTGDPQTYVEFSEQTAQKPVIDHAVRVMAREFRKLTGYAVDRFMFCNKQVSMREFQQIMAESLNENYDWDRVAFWCHARDKYWVETDDHHAQDVYLEPSNYGLERSEPELAKWVKKAKSERIHWDDPEILEGVAEDFSIWNMMFERQWVRGNFHPTTKEIDVMGHKRDVMAVLEWKLTTHDIEVVHGDIIEYGERKESFTLRGMEEIDNFVRKGYLPR